MECDQLVSEYCAGPQQLRAAVEGMTAEELDARPIPGKWSTKQVICHIADFEPVYVDRMKRVIAENEPTLMSGDPDLFAARLAYDERDVVVELDFIEAARKHMGPILKSLRPADFLRLWQSLRGRPHHAGETAHQHHQPHPAPRQVYRRETGCTDMSCRRASTEPCEPDMLLMCRVRVRCLVHRPGQSASRLEV